MLEVKDVSLSLGHFQILQDLSFTLDAGETAGIIGPNGSGKTTLFNTLSGFHYPQKGSIYFKGQDVTRLRPYRRSRAGIGRVFQQSGVFREMTVLENVVTALEGKSSLWKSLIYSPSRLRSLRAESYSYLEQIGLHGKAHDKASSLSGGQLRLLEIIRTVAFGAELFLLDEPTAGVSPKMKDDVIALIKKLQQDGKTVLIIEHDINFIKEFCERIIVLDQGTVILDDSPEKVAQSQKLHEIYFGSAAA